MNSELILVINCGSSSLKFALYTIKHKLLMEGLAESLNSEQAKLHIKHFFHKKCTQNTPKKITLDTQDHEHAIELIITELQISFDLEKQLVGIGHRIVHGGDRFKQSVIIDKQVINQIEKCIPLAPLHNPANLLGISILTAHFPQLNQIAVFDTSFHQTMPAHAYTYAIPYRFFEEEGVRRYGFHGTSHRFVSLQAAKLLNKPLHSINLVSAHLGNGASVAAISNGQSVDTSMGMTPLEGLVMGTRSGDIDPGLFDYLISKKLSPDEISRMLNKESGLLGISGISNDMRTLCEKADQGHELSILAIEIFCFRLAKYIAAMMVSLSQFDALIFTGGIGENSALVREKTIMHLGILGFELDQVCNSTKRPDTIISRPGTKTILLIATNEEIMIVNDTLELIPGTF